MKIERGFTLVELMIVLTIVAILAAIAVPAYDNYLIRGRIADATSTLSSKRVAMEQFYQDNRTYIGAPDCPLDNTVDNTASRFFQFSCVAPPTDVVYTLQAVGTGKMANFTYTLDQANSRASNITRPGWANPNPNNCWAVRPDGSCS